MVHAKAKELKDMFFSHYAVYVSSKADKKNHSERLLLFYAVECGLKFLILNDIKGHTTEYFSKHYILKNKLDGKNGHNIKYMLSFLKCRSFSLPNLTCLNKTNVPPEEYNQVWRYGIAVDPQIQDQIEKELCKIVEWIRRKI